MQINLMQLRAILKDTGLPVYRDSAPVSANYPYIVYEFVEESHRRASNRVVTPAPLYQVAVITTGVETEYRALRDLLDVKQVAFTSFFAIPFDENDDTITQFITNVRCIE